MIVGKQSLQAQAPRAEMKIEYLARVVRAGAFKVVVASLKEVFT